jgi:hypothetical protein
MRKLADGLWVHEDSMKMVAADLALRMTIVCLKASVAVVLGWSFDRIVVTHGEIIENGAGETLRRLCARYE